MTKEDKQFLLKDLCSRLPYGVRVQVKSHKGIFDGTLITTTTKMNYSAPGTCCTLGEAWIDETDEALWLDYKLFKPYLRLMSSMTEEEKNDLRNEHIKDEQLFTQCIARSKQGDNTMRGKVIPHFAVDWCNKNHFDYRGLIEKGLALEAPEGMYITK